MPMYDFSCEHCGFEFEETKPTGTEQAECPSCNEDADRQITAIGGYSFEDASHLIDPGIDSVDHWIGKDAEKREKIVQNREHKKRQLNHKKQDDDFITRTEMGDYTVVDDDDTKEEVMNRYKFEEEFVRASREEPEKVQRQEPDSD